MTDNLVASAHYFWLITSITTMLHSCMQSRDQVNFGRNLLRRVILRHMKFFEWCMRECSSWYNYFWCRFMKEDNIGNEWLSKVKQILKKKKLLFMNLITDLNLIILCTYVRTYRCVCVCTYEKNFILHKWMKNWGTYKSDQRRSKKV